MIRCRGLNHPLASYVKEKLKEVNFRWNEERRIKKESISAYYNIGIDIHHKMLSKANRDIENLACESNETKIHIDYYAYINNYSIEGTTFTNTNQKHMLLKLKKNGIVTYGDLSREREEKKKPTLWYEVMQIMASFPRSWKKLLERTRRNYAGKQVGIPIKENLWKQQDNVSLKEIKERICNKIENQQNGDNIKRYINTRHKLEIQTGKQNPFITLQKTTKEIKLRNVQYKILHNIYPTMNHLHKWKLKNTPNCSHCNEKETSIHAIFECPIAKDALVKTTNILKNEHGIEVRIEAIDCLYGIDPVTHGHLNSQQHSLVNVILILVKRKLILQREEKQFITELEIHNKRKQEGRKRK